MSQINPIHSIVVPPARLTRTQDQKQRREEPPKDQRQDAEPDVQPENKPADDGKPHVDLKA